MYDITIWQAQLILGAIGAVVGVKSGVIPRYSLMAGRALGCMLPAVPQPFRAKSSGATREAFQDPASVKYPGRETAPRDKPEQNSGHRDQSHG